MMCPHHQPWKINVPTSNPTHLQNSLFTLSLSLQRVLRSNPETCCSICQWEKERKQKDNIMFLIVYITEKWKGVAAIFLSYMSMGFQIRRVCMPRIGHQSWKHCVMKRQGQLICNVMWCHVNRQPVMRGYSWKRF